jgi:RsiW-degrading membrane proteinase PrsW (M82 family)
MADPDGAPASQLGIPVTRPRGPQNHLLALALATLGGLLGVVGAFIQEVRGGDLILAFVGAPIIEEALKPAGVYVLLIRWPHLLRGQLYTAGLAGLAGLCFGVIESAVYVNVYLPDHTQKFVIYRFTVPLLMHSLASFIVGLGINQRLLASIRGEIPLLQGSRKFFITGVVLHALLNAGAVALSLAGILDVE